MSDDASFAADPRSLIRSGQYRALLVLAAAIGLFVSTAAWLFLELVHETCRTTSATTAFRCGGRFRGWHWPAC